ncbi:DsbA family oxidoreductase [Salinispirillum marinum]|uniref:DsbA family oxidoreductase n=2 Tax=Saccharospirillaceae TaxID=255527 RepID=A0ABV8BJL6_9GAMM
MSTPVIDIKIASDVVCPWCAIGYAHLQQALATLKDEVQADVSWLPFELNPDIAFEGEELGEHLARKYGSTAADSEANRARITSLGEKAGFTFNFSPDMRIFGTFQAHRLLRWVGETHGAEQQTALKQALFSAYFQRHENPNDLVVLQQVAESVGLVADDVQAVLASDQYADDVRQEEAQLQRMGVSSVPTFIINNQYAITGGQPTDVFVQALRQIAGEMSA